VNPLIAEDTLCVCGHYLADHTELHDPDRPSEPCTECDCANFTVREPFDESVESRLDDAI